MLNTAKYIFHFILTCFLFSLSLCWSFTITFWSNFSPSAAVSTFPVRVDGLFSEPSPVGWTWISPWVTRLYFWRFLWRSYLSLILNWSYILSLTADNLIRDWKTLSYFFLIEFSFGWTQIWFFWFWFSQIWAWWPFHTSFRIAYGRFRVHLWRFNNVVQWWHLTNKVRNRRYHFSLFLFRSISSLSPLMSGCLATDGSPDSVGFKLTFLRSASGLSSSLIEFKNMISIIFMVFIVTW